MLRLALAFNKYFLEVAYGTLWGDCRFSVERDIKNIRKWDRKDKKSIINVIESIKSAVVERDGSIPDYFLFKDSIYHDTSIVNKKTARYLQELNTGKYSKIVSNLIKPIPPTNQTHGTATQYIAMFSNIQNYYEKSLNQR